MFGRTVLKLNIKALKEISALILLYVLLLFSSGFYFQSFNGTISVGIMMIAAILLMCLYRDFYDKAFNRMLFFCIVLSIIMGIIGLINKDGIKYIMLDITGIVIAMGIIYALKHEEFFELFIKLVALISIFSLFFWGISYIEPKFIYLFPNIKNSQGFNSYFCIFAFVNFANMRNYGIFWEPGAFAVFLSLAMLLEVFRKDKTRWGVIFLLTITILTTYSTLGIVSLGLIFLIWILKKREKIWFKGFKICLFLLLCLLSFYFLIKIEPDFKYAFIDKLLGIFDSTTKNDSILVRKNSFIELFDLFVNSPLIGVGYSGIQQKSLELGMDCATMTTFYWFARYGIAIGCVLLFGIFKFSFLLTKNYFLQLMIVGSIVLFTATECLPFNPCFLVFPLYGYYGGLDKRRSLICYEENHFCV